MEEKISYAQIEEYCNNLHALAKEMKEEVDSIAKIKDTISGGDVWFGDASKSYSNKLRDVINRFEEVFVEMENSILYMASCAEGFQEVDNVVMQEICSNLNITEPSLETSSIYGGV